MPSDRSVPEIEWPTLVLLVVTYGAVALGTTWLYGLSPLLGIILTGIAIGQFSSLQHEALHGHPFRAAWLNTALVFPALSVTVPYGRFKATHLAHHHDPNLTDPYDDPESNYCDPHVWATLSHWQQAILRVNNTLLGRVTLGPAISNVIWLRDETRLLRAGREDVRRDWLLHLGGLVVLALWLTIAAMPLWAYLAAAYLGMALLKIRTFLEHRAHDAARARTVIVEDRGPLALLFLNNNLHAVHHMHPQVPWYKLPALYAGNREHYLRRNDGYVYSSYARIIARYVLRAKDPVPHPLMGKVEQDRAA